MAVCQRLYQGILSGADDPVWRGVVAGCHAQLRRPLSHRAQSPGIGQPTHQPGSGPSWKRRRGPAAPAPGRHAQLLLPRRGLSWRTSAGAAKRWRCRYIRHSFAHRIIRNENESSSCISPSPGFGPQSFAEPCDWPRAENVRFCGPYGVTVDDPAISAGWSGPVWFEFAVGTGLIVSRSFGGNYHITAAAPIRRDMLRRLSWRSRRAPGRRRTGSLRRRTRGGDPSSR